MFRRYSFIPLFIALLAIAGGWAERISHRRALLGKAVAHASVAGTVGRGVLGQGPDGAGEPELQTGRRRELLEVLDRVIAYEFYYRSVYGRFTRLLSRIGYSIPRSVAEVYEIRVIEAGTDRLLVSALSEVNGRTMDLASVTQNYELNANFPLPAPRPEYVRLQAFKHLRALRESKGAPERDLATVFRGYFAFKLRYGVHGERRHVAMGLRPPVAGAELELGEGTRPNDNENELLAELSAEDAVLLQGRGGGADGRGTAPSLTGQWSRSEMSTTLEEAYLAQRIFRGEVGRYAKSWSELSQIASFPFRSKDQYGSDSAPFGDAPTVDEVVRNPAQAAESGSVPTSGRESHLPSSGAGEGQGEIEIEAISAEEAQDLLRESKR